MKYFISFTHKLLPTGKIDFQNCVIELEPGELLDIRTLEKSIQNETGLQDIVIINFIRVEMQY